MNYLGVHIVPDLLEEHWRELERKRELARAIRERRTAHRAARPSPFAAIAARLRGVLQPAPQPVPDGC